MFKGAKVSVLHLTANGNVYEIFKSHATNPDRPCLKSKASLVSSQMKLLKENILEYSGGYELTRRNRIALLTQVRQKGDRTIQDVNE